MDKNFPWIGKSKIFQTKNSGTSSFFYQVNFSILLLEVCFQLLSLSYIVQFEPALM